MVLEVTIETVEKFDRETEDYDAYTVHVGSHRILTICSHCDFMATKWLKDAVKSTKNSKLGLLIVGISVDRRSLEYTRHGLRDSPYDILQLCIGSQCLIYHLADFHRYCTPKFLKDVFDHSRVICVGMDMEAVSKKLLKDHGIKIKNPMDLKQLAIQGLKREDLDLRRYDLDRLVHVVLGKRMEMVRPRHKVYWYEGGRWPCWYRQGLRPEKVKYATVDPYLCFLMGLELLEMIKCPRPSSSSKKNNKNKRSS